MSPNDTPRLDALLVGYEDQENLGLRWIAATLQAHGLRAAVQQHTPGNASGVLAAVQANRPRLVGFSIIFQSMLGEFGALMKALRAAGVDAHFTCGGHFPSLRPRETLESLPYLDSIVRFEGELTALELISHLDDRAAWPAIQGLAFRSDSDVLITPPRPLIADLDTLPPPVRGEPHEMSRNIRVASMLASRGCVNDCAFCSIRQFYGGAPGLLRRTRSVGAVVREMRELYDRDGIRFFVFQDDDFAARSRQQQQWIEEFLCALEDAGLSQKIAWKMSCRVDDVREDIIAACQQRGLVGVYLGVESGSPAGLRTLNKRVTVEQNLQAIAILKKLNMTFDMGFMLFDPDTTIESIQENIDFLRAVTSDGSCPANFCKMLPYAGTPVEARLKIEGRLRGTASWPDYSFLDPRLDWYGVFAARTFRFRNFDWLGLVERLRVARFDQVLAAKFEPGDAVQAYDRELLRLTAAANTLALNILQRALDFVRARDVTNVVQDFWLLNYLMQEAASADVDLQQQLDRVLAVYNPVLLDGFAAAFARREAAGEFDRGPVFAHQRAEIE